MKPFLLYSATLALVVFAAQANAGEYVHGYTRSNGTYVQGYERSSPDNTVTNNYSYQGNVNPYTGQTGSNTYSHDTTSPYYIGPDSQGNVGHAEPSQQQYNPYVQSPYGR
jgi:hypothetical protein